MRKAKNTLLIFHGASSLSRPNILEKWVPKLSTVLGRDWKIALPELPEPDSPRVDAWLTAASEAIDSISGPVHLTGHSLGGSVLLQVAARRLPKPAHLFVAAAPFWCGGDADWQHEPFRLIEDDILSLQSGQITFYHGTADDIVPFKHMSEYQEAFPHAMVRAYEGMNHIDPSDAFLMDLASDLLSV